MQNLKKKALYLIKIKCCNIVNFTNIKTIISERERERELVRLNFAINELKYIFLYLQCRENQIVEIIPVLTAVLELYT